jgi:hypothetical protein
VGRISGKAFVKQQAERSSQTSYDRHVAQRLWSTSAELMGIGVVLCFIRWSSRRIPWLGCGEPLASYRGRATFVTADTRASAWGLLTVRRRRMSVGVTSLP